MGLFDRISRVVRSNLNDIVSNAEDPEKMLEQSVLEMQEDLVQLRQGVAQAIAAQKRSEQQYNQSQNEANKWQRNAQLALQKGDENLARQALERKKSFSENANTIKTTLDSQVGQIDTLKRSLIGLESKISEAKTKKDMLKARSAAAKAQENLQSTVGRLGTSSAAAAFERMEEKLLPTNVDYTSLRGLSREAAEKLNKVKPRSLGQAARISGVTPADVNVLVIYLETQKRGDN